MAARKTQKVFGNGGWSQYMTPPKHEVKSPFGSFDDLEKGIKKNPNYSAGKRSRR